MRDIKWQTNLFCYAAGREMGKSREMTTRRWKHTIDRLEVDCVYD